MNFLMFLVVKLMDDHLMCYMEHNLVVTCEIGAIYWNYDDSFFLFSKFNCFHSFFLNIDWIFQDFGKNFPIKIKKTLKFFTKI